MGRGFYMRIALAAAALLASAAASAQAEPVSALSVSYNIDVGPVTMTVVRYVLDLKEGAMREDAALAASKRRMCMHTAFGAGALLGMIGGKRRRAAYSICTISADEVGF
jgi:hypothetical protein